MPDTATIGSRVKVALADESPPDRAGAGHPHGPGFDPGLFQDQIHLTPAGLELVAGVIHDRLKEDGAVAD